jgi:uncharacterized radical SAM superfamily Fe-S cluster-containing enzyme
MMKTCDAHGRFEVLIARDPRFYHFSVGAGNACCGSNGDNGCCDAQPPGSARSTQRSELSTSSPFDTLSSCLALIEIVDSCNLRCPTCYAGSPFGINDEIDCISFENYTNRVEGVLDRKGSIDILQLTGGEPTIHPEFAQFLEWALREKRIGYVLINTNLVRVATDRTFREALGELRRRYGKFEFYAQFDGPQAEGQIDLRAADLREIRRKAIDEAGALGVPTTLAMTVTPVTIRHLGETLRFGLERRHVRGITFQPMFTSGRVPPVESSTLPVICGSHEPIAVADVILNLVEQSEGLLTIDDFTPLPCGDPNCHTIGYLLRTDGGTIGLSRLIDLESLQGFLKDRVDYRIEDLAKCGCETEPLGEILKQFEIAPPPDAALRIFIKPFMDAWTFDQDRIDRCCTHVIRPDGQLDSFCRYYLHGGKNEPQRIEPQRARKAQRKTLR